MAILKKLIFLLFVILFLSSPSTYAEQKIITAEGVYIANIQDNNEEIVAKEKAKKDSLRNAIEQACVYIKSISESTNLKISSDEIESFARGNVQVLDEYYNTKVDVQNGMVSYICTIRALVDFDDSKLGKAINNDIKLLSFISNELEEIVVSSDKIHCWFNPKTVLHNGDKISFMAILKREGEGTCTVSDFEINPTELLFKCNDSKVYDIETGKLIGETYGQPLNQWLPYEPRSIFEYANFRIIEYENKIANNFALKYYDQIKGKAYELANKHVNINTNLYYADSSYSKNNIDDYLVRIIFFMPDTITRISNDIILYKGLMVVYNMGNHPINELTDFTQVSVDCYGIIDFEIHKNEQQLYYKNFIKYNSNGIKIAEGTFNVVIPIDIKTTSYISLFADSINDFYSRYVK